MAGTFGLIEEISQEGHTTWPEARSGHRMCADENFLYVFGGYDANRNNILYSQLWRFNLTTEVWVLLPDPYNMAPIECASSSMVLWKNMIIIFAGSGFPFTANNSNKLLMYCLKTYRWIDLNYFAMARALKNPDGSVQECIKTRPCGCIKIKYRIPKPKYGQSSALTQNDKIFFYSGTTGTYFRKELHSFSLKKLRWDKLKLCSTHISDAPCERYRHEAVLDDKTFYIFGGAVLRAKTGKKLVTS